MGRKAKEEQIACMDGNELSFLFIHHSLGNGLKIKRVSNLNRLKPFSVLLPLLGNQRMSISGPKRAELLIKSILVECDRGR